VRETAQGSGARFARDDSEALACGSQRFERLAHAGEGGHELVVVRVVVGAVRRHHRSHVGGVPRELRELHVERAADAAAPERVVVPVEAVLEEHVAERAADQLDRIDERAVEVEQHGAGAALVGHE
jgi:hypothetical protein